MRAEVGSSLRSSRSHNFQAVSPGKDEWSDVQKHYKLMNKDSQRHIKFNKYSKKGCRKIHLRHPFYVISTNNLKIN